MSIQVNRSCSRYITSMATLLLRWTSSQVVTVKLFTHVLIGDHPLVEDTTCTYPTTLQATAIPSHTVAGPTPSPLGTLHITLPVNFMQDPSISLPLMLKCFTRQQLKPCKSYHVCNSKPSINWYIWTRFSRPSQRKVFQMEVFVLVQGIYELFKADLKLIATELLLSPKGRYKCPKQHTKSTKKSHWWNMPNFASKMAWIYHREPNHKKSKNSCFFSEIIHNLWKINNA